MYHLAIPSASKENDPTSMKAYLSQFRFFWVLGSLLMWGVSLLSQVDTIQTEDLISNHDMLTDQQIEDLITNLEVDEQVDYTIFTDRLNDLKRRPVNLNTATREDLQQLPGMTDLKILKFEDYRAKFGRLTSLYELQAIPGFSLELIQQIRPYCTVKEAGPTDISPGVRHPSGPSLDEIFSGLKTEFTQRFVIIPEEQLGFTDPDTTFIPIIGVEGDTLDTREELSTRYVGSPWRSYSRLRMRYAKNVSMALTGEKDPGEEFRWSPEEQYYGYDFLSGHVAIQNFGNLKSLVVGDYNLQVGQGLVLSKGLGFGKGAEVISTLKQPNLGIRPYASVNENQFLRGAATKVAFGDIYITGFYSTLKRDASVQLNDTLFESIEAVNNLQTSGFHRTPNELASRRAVDENMYGGRLEYKRNTFQVGATHYVQQFGAPLQPGTRDYQQFDFSGDENYVSGIDFDFLLNNVNFFGEVARSKSGGFGGVVGLMSSLSPKLDVGLHLRHFDRDFHSNRAFTFAERPTVVQGEQGLYLGVKLKLSPKWSMSTYFDQYSFTGSTFRASFPSQGHEYLAQIEYKPKRGTLAYVRFRSDNRERNASIFPEGQRLDFLVPTQKNQLRVHFQSRLTRSLEIKSRAEFSVFTKEGEDTHRGMLVYQDISWRWGFKLKLTARYAIFDAPNFEARIYAYENDILGFFSIPPYFNTGRRYYGILNYKATRNIEFWVRWAQSRFHEQASVGSGLNRIEGNTQSELKLQVRVKF